MNKISLKRIAVICVLVVPSCLYSQHLGIGGGYATSSAVFGEFFYQEEPFSFHVGGTWQFSNAKGKAVTEQKQNYGQTALGDGTKYYSVDVGIGCLLFGSRFQVNGEFSVIIKKYFTNYKDARFNEGGYHLIHRTVALGAEGASLGFHFDKNFSVFAGYNTYRRGIIGARLTFAR